MTTEFNMRSAVKAAREAREYWLNQCEVGATPAVKEQAKKLVESYDRIIKALARLEGQVVGKKSE